MPLNNRANPVGIISTKNSTTTPLGIGGVFTGLAEEVKDFALVAMLVFSDNASATMGLSVQWSSDGTNWDDDDAFSIPANNGKFFTFAPEGNYFRVVYTNGAVAQTTFRLQTILKPVYTKSSSHRIGDAIVDDDDAELIKSVITGLGTDGIYRNVGLTNGGSIRAAALQEASLENGTLFGAALSRDSAGAPENVALFRNDGVTAIRIHGIDLGYPANSEWEVYLNPTTSANGTLITTVPLKTDSVATTGGALYNAPTVTVVGTLLYGFQNSASSRANALPGVIILASGHRVLFRRITTGAGSKINLNVNWSNNNV